MGSRGRAGSDVSSDEADRGQFLEALGEHAVADAGDALAHLREVGRAFGQGHKDQGVPASAQQGEGPSGGRRGPGRPRAL